VNCCDAYWHQAHGPIMRRREFIGIVGGVAAWPFSAYATPLLTIST
jgi:hypothetical protein